MIPANSKATEITINKVLGQTKKLDYRVAPAQYPEPIGVDDRPKGFVEPNKEIYNSDAPYPSVYIKIVDQGLFRGNRIVTLAVYPFRYYPAKNELEIISSVDFTLTYGNNDIKTVENQVEIDENSLSGKILKSIIDNNEDVKKYGIQHKKKSQAKSVTIETEPVLKSVSNTNSISISANYVIVTSSALAPAFNEFIAWKKRKGVDIQLVTTENIYANYTGDLVSGINDNAGKVREFLKDAYNNGNGIDYALLAGDYPIVPIRYGYDINSTTNNNYIIPTDLYFADFNGDWEVDSDGRYGEPHDNVNFTPEIFVGRIMVTTEAEVKNWTKKVKTYELNPGNGNYSYLTKAFFTQADQLMQGDQANYILTRIPWISSSNRTVFEEQGGFCTSVVPSFPTGNNVINEFNNHYGLCSFMAHGSPCNVAVSTIYLNSDYYCNGTDLPVKCANNTKYKVTAFDNGAAGCGGISESGNGFDNMTNTDYPSIYYSISCTTMPFDDFETTTGERNMGESYTCISPGGGPIYLGNTRYGWVEDSYLLFEQFINAINDSSFFNIGVAEAKSKIWYNDRYLRFSHNLLGCPETELWTATPTIYTGATVTENGNNVSVNTNGVTGSTICVMNALNLGYFNVQSNVTSYMFTDVPKPYYVTIDKHNKIPYTSNPTNVFIENNQTINSIAYLNCQTLSAGYDVIPNNGIVGNVVIQNGASITFDVTGDILLDSGFEVQLGATFEAK